MTDSNFCCLCASDEGVFLDIFTATDRQLGNRSFLKEFETCLSVKVNRDEALSSKICHKCAIELGQCNQFVEKYHQVYDATLKPKKTVLKKSCCLCLSTSKKNHLFTLAKDFRSTIDPLEKIHKCFNKQITREEAENRSICLFCRYNLDVLYDLRKLASEVTSKLQRIAESKAILANLPKTQTFVVNRKTTINSQSKVKLGSLSDSDSECGTMARKRSTSKKLGNVSTPVELKLRTCGQCNTSVEGGLDMYRLHSTGVTVCKMCWITMDPFKPSRASKRKRQNQAEVKNTRLCAVFLKDVLSPASSKDKGSSKVEKDQKEETIYTVSDNSLCEEEKSNVRPVRNLRTRRSRGADKSDQESDTNLRQRLKRNLKQEEPHEDSGSNKRSKSIKTETITVAAGLRKSTRYQSSDSDSVKAKSRHSDILDMKCKTVNKAKGLPKVNNTHSGDKLSNIKSNKNYGKRKGANTETVKSKSEDSSSSVDGGVERKLRKVRNKVPLILKPELPDSPKSKKNSKHAMPRMAVPSKSPVVSKSSSLQSSAKNQPSKIELPPKRAKTLIMVSFPTIFKAQYECKICRAEFHSKLIGMKHELTHFKQVEIKIEKLNITHHFQTVDQNSPTSELPDASCSLNLPTTNEIPVQPELPTSTGPPRSDEDQGEEPDHETEEGETILRRSKSSESIQQVDKSPDIDDAEETEAVISSNGLPAEESTSPTNESKTETAEIVAPESAADNNDGLKTVDTSSAEADSVMETNTVNGDDAVEASNETVEEHKSEEPAEELAKTVDDIEEKKDAENESGEGVAVPSPNETATVKDVEKDKDSGEEMESDTDIRIVDTGSSAEDTSETEKRTDPPQAAKNVSVEIVDTDDKLIDTKEESKLSNESKDSTKDEPEAEITSIIDSGDNLDAKNKANDMSLQNEEVIETEREASELCQKIEEDVRPLTTVTEILQEVIDLATAEVQKRAESEVPSVPETLENISEEIKKTAEGSAAVDNILASIDTAKNIETDSCKLGLNSIENSVKNHLDVISTTDV